ncbi:DUF7680 family protein [Halarchaeum nitratireducens]|uniref:DUF7680 domain-containing protein n=1 Tax=Halarchaeum nitratireducens TaxID=489913 RepID=A0A830GET3_9EURY|nr:hypothetical protein [Halarchaeum nitratireducens]GGN25390.1 hypothetical protein GCM10009021_29220 [Halarchaeum nitratireducens]
MKTGLDSTQASTATEDAPVSSFGSSVYGGRPTFAMTRREEAHGGEVTLYELLPEEQAAARRDRLERRGRSLTVESFEEVFEDSSAVEATRWEWKGWTAVKIARLDGGRFRSLSPLIKDTVDGAELDPTAVTSSGAGDLFLPETVGVRLALAFRGIKPLQRVDRMRALCRGIARMGDEECYYWHAKCRAPSSPNGEKALRTLLTDHL